MTGSARSAVIACVLMLAPATAGGAEPETAPIWIRRPTPDELLVATPKLRKDAWAGGRAVIRCMVDPKGEPRDCAVVEEDPGGRGLGAAALSLAPRFRLAPDTVIRSPDGRIDIPVNFPSAGFPGADWEPADWVRRPTPSELRVFWPVQDWDRWDGGKAQIKCKVGTDGSAFGCEVAEESPPDSAFGEAAIAMTPQFRFKPARLWGEPVVSVVSLPFNFQRPPDASALGIGPQDLTDPAWRTAPSFADVVAAYPDAARSRGEGGQVALECALTLTGSLDLCDVLSEGPERLGFAKAARRLARRFSRPVEQAHFKTPYAVRIQFAFDPGLLTDAAPAVAAPVWAARPNPAQLAALFPQAAVNAGVRSGRAELVCTVQADGSLDGCTAQGEAPAGLGFGAAALRLAPTFRLPLWTDAGLPVIGGLVRAPVHFQAEDAVAPSQTPTPP